MQKLIALVVLVLVAACGSPSVSDDAGTPMDAGVFDAGATDAGRDAGPPDAGRDAGSPDAGQPDSGSTPDAGAPDGGDAGSADSGALDAGSDAGVTDDAGITDAGPADAGITDAGMDAGSDAGAPDAGGGCQSPLQCLSGACLPSGDCLNCQADSECGPGRVCATGVCAPACVSSSTCDSNQRCCGGRCTDVQRDPSHCGQCDLPCTNDQFCGRGSCREANFSQLCELPQGTVLLDGLRDDDDAGLALGQSVSASCTPAMPIRLVGVADAGVLSAEGAPLALGELLLVGGGSFRQPLVNWLETTNNALVRDTSTATQAIYSLRDGGVVSQVPVGSLGPGLDRFLIQVVRAPSGSLVLNAAGYFGAGTLAAAQYFVDVVNPMRATLRWYVVEWEDLDASGGPTPGDRYTVIASGS